MPTARVEIATKLLSFGIESTKPVFWESAYTEGGGYTEVIANGVTDQSMNMLGVAVANLVVVLSIDKTITVKLNSSVGTAFSLPAGGAILMAGVSITAIFVTNASGAPATVQVVAIG